MSGQIPTVSIVLPTRNGARYLAQSVESCLRQTWTDFELILVDDGSTDTTPDIIRTFNDPRLVCVRHAKNQGLAPSLNHGFELSRGRFLTWTSDDNYYAPEALSTMVDALRACEDAAFVYAHYQLVDENGALVRPGRVREPAQLDDDNCVGSCFLYRREVYEKLGGYALNANLVEDYEYWLRVRAHFPMKMLEPFLYFHRHHPTSLTMTHSPGEILECIHRIRKPYVSAAKYKFFEAQRAYHRQEWGMAAWHAFLSLIRNPFFVPAWRVFIKALIVKQ